MKLLKEGVNWRQIKLSKDFTLVEKCIKEVITYSDSLISDIESRASYNFKYKENYLIANVRLWEFIITSDSLDKEKYKTINRNTSDIVYDADEFKATIFKSAIKEIEKIASKYNIKVKPINFYVQERGLFFQNFYAQLTIPYSDLRDKGSDEIVLDKLKDKVNYYKDLIAWRENIIKNEHQDPSNHSDSTIEFNKEEINKLNKKLIKAEKELQSELRLRNSY